MNTGVYNLSPQHKKSESSRAYNRQRILRKNSVETMEGSLSSNTTSSSGSSSDTDASGDVDSDDVEKHNLNRIGISSHYNYYSTPLPGRPGN